MAEGQGFEPWDACTSTVFKTVDVPQGNQLRPTRTGKKRGFPFPSRSEAVGLGGLLGTIWAQTGDLPADARSFICRRWADSRPSPGCRGVDPTRTQAVSSFSGT